MSLYTYICMYNMYKNILTIQIYISLQYNIHTWDHDTMYCKMLCKCFRDVESPFCNNCDPYSSKGVEHAHTGVMSWKRRLGLSCALFLAPCFLHGAPLLKTLSQIRALLMMSSELDVCFDELSSRITTSHNTEENWCPLILALGSLSLINYLAKNEGRMKWMGRGVEEEGERGEWKAMVRETKKGREGNKWWNDIHNGMH